MFSATSKTISSVTLYLASPLLTHQPGRTKHSLAGTQPVESPQSCPSTKTQSLVTNGTSSRNSINPSRHPTAYIRIFSLAHLQRSPSTIFAS